MNSKNTDHSETEGAVEKHKLKKVKKGVVLPRKNAEKVKKDASPTDNKDMSPTAKPLGAPVNGLLQTCVGPLTEYQVIPENIPKHAAVLAAGKRRTGKSTSFDNMMEKVMAHIPFGIVMTETKLNGFWQRRVPERFVYQGLRDDILSNLVARQRHLVEKFGPDDPRIFAFVILDDVIADQNAIRYSKLINSLFTEGRHLKISVWITTQYMKGIGPMIRGNCDIVIAQPIYGETDRDVLHKLFANFLPKKEFMMLMDEVVRSEELPGHTANEPKLAVRVLVIEDHRQVPDALKKFHYWEPVHSDELSDYKLCDPIYWKKDHLEGGNLEHKKTKNVGETFRHINKVLKL